MSFAVDVWNRFRPYLLHRIEEFLEAATLWFSLYLLKQLTIWLKVGGWVESFIIRTHEVATVVAFVFLAYYGVEDIVLGKNTRRSKGNSS
jgi:hypothetical protein